MSDQELIQKLGGVDVLHKYLGLSYQCVFNWKKRKIPAQVKIDHPELFLTDNPPNLNQLEPA